MNTAAALPGWPAWLLAWDTQLSTDLRQGLLDGPPGLVLAVAWLSHLGDRWVIGGLVAGACVWLVWRGQAMRAAAVAVLVSAQGLLVWTLKDWVDRARPAAGAIEAAWVVVNGSSMPSGHASAAMLGFGLLAWLALRDGCRPPRHRIAAMAVALCLALAVGASRVLLGVHFPTDVLAGWCLGAVWLALSIRLLDALPSVGTSQGRSHRQSTPHDR